MSNQISPIAVRPFLFVLICSTTLLISTDKACPQSEGFSIFNGPAEQVLEKAVERVAPTVSPKEAFTNPTATLPKSQFGSFGNANSTNTSTPAMKGPKAIGTYARASSAGSAAKAQNSVSATASKLAPFSGNSLRPSQQPQAEKAATVSSIPATPLRAEDFPPTARRLNAAPTAQAFSETPRIAQVAFQEGGFNPRAGQGSTPAVNRFQTGTGQSASSPPRFSFGNSSSNASAGQASSAPAAQPRQNPFTQQPAAQQPQPVQGFSTQQAPRRNFPQQRTGNSARSGFSNNAAQGQARTGQARSGQLRDNQARGGQTGFANSRGQGDRSQVQNSQQSTRNPRTTGQGQARPNERQASSRSSIAQTNPKSAKEILNAWIALDSQEEIPGKRMKFHEFLGQPINGSRKDAINQYWVTFTDLARYRMAIEQTEWLKSISKPRQESEQAILAAAQQAAQNRVLHSEIQLAKSQSILSDFLPNLRQNGKLVAVVPSNIPWVGKLNTKFDEYQSRGMVPSRFATINDYLPKARTLIANEADAVIASKKAADKARSAMQSGQTAIANVLEAARMKQHNEEEFLSAVLGYNRAITDYVLSVRQDIYQPKRLASVLIGRKSVEPTAATASRRGTDSTSGALSDFSQIERSSRIQPPSEDSDPTDTFSQNNNQRNSRQQTRVASSQKIQFGPTASSAKAANFDPNNVKTELPMQQINPNANADTYGSNDQSNPGSRTATNPAAARSRQRFGGQPAAQPRQGAPTPRGGAGSFPGSIGGQGAASSVPSIPNTRATGAPSGTFNGASAAAPRVGSFAGAAQRPAATTGGGTFGGAAVPRPTAPATASGLSTPGFSTRR